MRSESFKGLQRGSDTIGDPTPASGRYTSYLGGGRRATDSEFEERCEAADRVNADLHSDLCQACFDDAESELRGIPEGDGIKAYQAP